MKNQTMIFMKVHEDENGFISSFIYESIELFAKKVDFGNDCCPILGFQY